MRFRNLGIVEIVLDESHQKDQQNEGDLRTCERDDRVWETSQTRVPRRDWLEVVEGTELVGLMKYSPRLRMGVLLGRTEEIRSG